MRVYVEGDSIAVEAEVPDSEYGAGVRFSMIPFEAIASWGELLGYASPTETLNAILHVMEHGEPEPDPETGHNAWTASYLAIGEREQKRKAEEYVKVDPAIEVRSLGLRQALAASTVKDDVLDAQASARAALGLPDPKPAIAPLGRMGTMSVDPDPVRDLLDEHADAIEAARQQFLEQLA